MSVGLPRWAISFRGLFVLVVVVLCTCKQTAKAAEDAVQIWEFSPYKVHVWYDFDPSIVESMDAKKWFLETIERELQLTFRATWSLQFRPLPRMIASDWQQQFESVSVEKIASREIVLVVSSTHPETRIVRTYQAACETLGSIAASSATRSALVDAAQEYGVNADSNTGMLLEKTSTNHGSDLEILQALTDGKLPAALLPRNLVKQRDNLRVLLTLLPWQTDSLLNDSDKLFFLSIGMEGDRYLLKAREIDCPMRFFGPSQQARSNTWSDAVRMASFLIRKAFAPIARVESAEATTAQLRQRAGGLILDDDLLNPSRIQTGDVMQPIIRRDDRSGVPTLLQALDFTYAAITESDGVRMQANVYTYSGGPGLRGRQNPRTHRVLLRVRPQQQANDLQIVVRGNTGQAQAGCFVYSRDHLTDEFTYLGRTDWRGRLTIPKGEAPTQVLPAAIKSERDAARRQAREAALAQARQVHDELVNRATAEGKDPPEFVPPIIEDSTPPLDPSTLIPLSATLIQLYVKSGETVVARLPFVSGLKDVEVAELPDDRLRLQSEAMVRGFQGEILDLIGQRNLLAARVRLLVQKSNIDRANQAMEQLRNLKDFNQMNDQLSQLQRTILEQTDASVPRSAQAQIDRMFKTTRDILQKYLQQDIVAETARLLRESNQ